MNGFDPTARPLQPGDDGTFDPRLLPAPPPPPVGGRIAPPQPPLGGALPPAPMPPMSPPQAAATAPPAPQPMAAAPVGMGPRPPVQNDPMAVRMAARGIAYGKLQPPRN